jgi:hypothetical protein
MRIGCLAWGSLVWDPRTLPGVGPFLEDGPRIPIEFSRISIDGRVTLVIDREAPRLRTLWIPFGLEDLDAAVEALGRREKIVPEKWAQWVGRRGPGRSQARDEIEEEVDRWLSCQPLDAVVWTALPAREPDGGEARPSLSTLLSYLESLTGQTRSRAEEYIRRTPRSVRTPHRGCFEEILGWHPTDS